MKNKYRYVITAGQQLLLLMPLIIITILIVGGALYYFGGRPPADYWYILVAIVFVLEILPVTVVHIQYLMKNKGGELVVDTDEKRLSYTSPERQLSYAFNEISAIHYYVSYGRGSGWYAFEAYRFCRILFTDGQELVVTCLMVNKLEKTLPPLLGVEVIKHLRVLALIMRS